MGSRSWNVRPLPISPIYPTPPTAAAVYVRLREAPATADVLAEDFDCLTDQIMVILIGFDCFTAVPGARGLEWIALDPPEGPQLVDLERCAAVVAGVVLFLLGVFLVGMAIGARP